MNRIVYVYVAFTILYAFLNIPSAIRYVDEDHMYHWKKIHSFFDGGVSEQVIRCLSIVVKRKILTNTICCGIGLNKVKI